MAACAARACGGVHLPCGPCRLPPPTRAGRGGRRRGRPDTGPRARRSDRRAATARERCGQRAAVRPSRRPRRSRYGPPGARRRRRGGWRAGAAGARRHGCGAPSPSRQKAAAGPDAGDGHGGQRGLAHLDRATEPPRHGGDLVVDHGLRQEHRVVGVDQAPAGDDVGTGGTDGGRLQGLLVAGLQAGPLAVGREPRAERRHPELVTHLGRHGGHQGALDATQREGGAQHVEDARAEAEDEARARRGDLERRRHAEELGEALHHGAGQGDRRGRAGNRHGVDLDRYASGGQRDVDVERGAVDLQRRGRRAHGRKARPRGEALEVAAEQLADAHHGVDLCRAVDERDVLRGLGEHGEVLEQLTAIEGKVGGADLGPHEVELGQLVVQGGAVAHVLQRAGAAHPGAKIERLRDAAARAEADRLARTEHDVVGRRRTGHHERARAAGQRPFDQLARQADDAGALVDPGAALGQQGQHARAGEAHAGVREELEGLVGDAALLVAREPRRVCLHRLRLTSRSPRAARQLARRRRAAPAPW